MKDTFYRITPPAEGEFGPETIWDPYVTPQKFTFAHLLVDRWPSVIITRYPVFLFEERLVNALIGSGVVGFSIRECKVERSEDYDAYRDIPDQCFPKFVEVLPVSIPQLNSIAYADGNLVISGNALNIINHFDTSDITIAPLGNGV